MIAIEDGVSNIPVAVAELPDGRILPATYAEAVSLIDMIVESEHDYKVLCVDTLNGLANLAAEAVCKEQFGGVWNAEKGKTAFLPFGTGWKATAQYMTPVRIAFDKARARGMTVILTTHIGTHNVNNPVHGTYQILAGDMDKNVWNPWCQWADVVAFADYDVTVLARDRGAGKVVGTTTRVLRCGGSVAEDSKCRVGFEVPEVQPLSWSGFAASIGRDTYTLDEVRSLWGVLSPDQVKATMSWLGVDRIEDAPVRKLRQVLNRLREINAQQQTEEEENNAA